MEFKSFPGHSGRLPSIFFDSLVNYDHVNANHSKRNHSHDITDITNITDVRNGYRDLFMHFVLISKTLDWMQAAWILYYYCCGTTVHLNLKTLSNI